MGCKCIFVFQEMAILIPMQSNRTTQQQFSRGKYTVIYYKQKVPHIAGKSKLNYHPIFEYKWEKQLLHTFTLGGKNKSDIYTRFSTVELCVERSPLHQEGHFKY